MTWNINNLCGVRWDGAVTASQLMETILSVNPDVVCLQETTVDGTPYTDPHFEAAYVALFLIAGCLRCSCLCAENAG